MAARRCKGTTKAGKRCRAPSLRPRTVIEGIAVKGEHCRTHDPELPDSARNQGAQPGSGRPRKPKLTEVLRERVEEEAERIVEAYFDALEATIVATWKGETYPSDVADHRARLEAAEKLLDRVYGKPRQTTTVTGDADKPVRISAEVLADPELRESLFGAARALDRARGRRMQREANR